jgi:hypothetical protein
VKKLLKLLAIGFGIIPLVAIVFALDVARFGGAVRASGTGFAGQCTGVAPAGGCEDVQIDRERGIAYLLVLNRASVARGKRQPRSEGINGALLQQEVLICKPAR